MIWLGWGCFMIDNVIFGYGMEHGGGGDTASRLASDLDKTDLGRKLAHFLKQQGYTVHVTKNFPKGHEGAAGLAVPSERKIYIRPGYGHAETLRIFAHETRHVGQFAVEQSTTNTFRLFHPVNRIAHGWLREMDAEAFAAHFISNHERRAGDGVMWAMMSDKSTSWKADFYRAYMKEVAATSGRDGARPMRAAFYSFLESPWMKRNYAQDALDGWDAQYRRLDRQTDYLSPLRRQFIDLAADSRGASGRELLFERALAYSKIFTEFGSPDYLNGQKLSAIEDKMTDEKAELRGNDAYRLEIALFQFRLIESRVAASATPVATGGLLSRLLKPKVTPAELNIRHNPYMNY